MKPRSESHLVLFTTAIHCNLGLSSIQAKQVYEFIEDIVKEEDSPKIHDREIVLKDFFENYNPLNLEWTLLIKDLLRQM